MTSQAISVLMNGKWNRNFRFEDETFLKAALCWIGFGIGLQVYRLICSFQRNAQEPPTAFRAGVFNLQTMVQMKLFVGVTIIPLFLDFAREVLHLF